MILTYKSVVKLDLSVAQAAKDEFYHFIILWGQTF